MKARILIVEDESIVQLDLQHRLERMGHSVVGTASNGEEAVAKAVQLKPDVVIMDVRLDGSMDGIEAARRIRTQQATAIVYVTAYASIFDAERQDVFGPWVSKPFRTTELEAAIAGTLAGGGRHGDNPNESARET
jgi:two-component system, cell cycle sensor histidine kinase and response regulator CckA